MRIKRVRADLVNIGHANAVYVRIETNTGLTGIGETVLKRREKSVLANVKEIGEFLIGKDPLRIEDLSERLYRDTFWTGGPLHAAGRSAVDIALWDLKGQHFGAPIYQMLGGPTRTAIATYAHCEPGATPDEFVSNARVLVDHGIHRIKTRLPLFYGRNKSLESGGHANSGPTMLNDPFVREAEYLSTRLIDEIAMWFAKAREDLGWEVELMLDCRGRLNFANAIRIVDALIPFKLLFLEEPLPPESADDYGRLNARSGIPIAAGERLSSLYEVRAYLERNAVGILQSDPVICGGITAAKKIAALAEAFTISYAPHNPNGPIATLAAAHVMFSIPNAFLLETGPSLLDGVTSAELVDYPPEVEGGLLRLREAPGLGAALLDRAPQLRPPEKSIDGR